MEWFLIAGVILVVIFFGKALDLIIKQIDRESRSIINKLESIESELDDLKQTVELRLPDPFADDEDWEP